MTTTLKVPDMTCGHCKAAVEAALLALDGVEAASVDLESKTVDVEYDPEVVETDRMTGVLEGIGYPATA